MPMFAKRFTPVTFLLRPTILSLSKHRTITYVSCWQTRVSLYELKSWARKFRTILKPLKSRTSDLDFPASFDLVITRARNARGWGEVGRYSCRFVVVVEMGICGTLASLGWLLVRHPEIYCACFLQHLMAFCPFARQKDGPRYQ